MMSPGTTLGGRYRLDERIAGGGMGDVWRGTDEVLGRTVAIKILLPALLEEPGFAERFRGEARTMATINHPGVVDVCDYGSEEGTAFLIMEYVEGDALSRTLSRVGRLTPGRTMALIAQAADALQAAHEKGIVHRDVKPGNLLVRPNGTLVLTDFGIARSAMVGQLTQAGSVLGTASYISPEQAAGSTASPLSDVYALGVVAYQCLSGRRPFEGDNPIEIAMRHVRDVPPPLPADIPPVVRQFVDRAMAKDPGARFPSASAMGQVARRAGDNLATGRLNPTSGAPTMPVSGPPGRPYSGAPVSGTPSPAGTRVMPNYNDGPVSPAGPRQGQYMRGAAAVPAAAPTSDTRYGYTHPMAPAGPRGTGAGRDSAGRSKGGIGKWLLAAIVLILVFCVGGIYLMRAGNSGADDSGGPVAVPTTEAPTTKPAAPPAKTTAPKPKQTTTRPAVPTNNLNCDDAQNQDVDDVRRELEKNNYKVRVIKDQPGGKKDRVAVMSPCGEQPEGTEVTLRVFTGKGNGGNGNQPGPGNSCNPFDPDSLASCLPNAERLR